MDVTVVIGTYGDEHWRELAQQRAVPSAQAAGAKRVVHMHGDTLAEARNMALDMVDTEWVIHLDADDMLCSDYIERMARGSADVRGPVVQFVREDNPRHWRHWQPRVFTHEHDCTAECLPEGNWLVIGSAVRTNMVKSVGGWREFPWSEDWDLWLRCWKVGASFELVRNAVYVAYVRDDSRNRRDTQRAKHEAHFAIHRANFPEFYGDPVP